MNLNAITNNSASNSATTATTAKTNGADQETFLKLLVAQLKNQDPLNPQDPSQFVAQLAQFSSLEQLTGINQKIDNFLAQAR